MKPHPSLLDPLYFDPSGHARLRPIFGRVIADARVLRRMSPQSLSVAAGLARQTVTNTEQGACNPRFEVMFRLSIGLGIPLSVLVGQAEVVLLTGEGGAGGAAQAPMLTY